MTETLNSMQGVLLPPASMADRLNAAGGIVRLEDLDWPLFDPERVTTMGQYVGEIGIRMAEVPREGTTTDSALHLYGRDFEQAAPNNLDRGLYYPSIGRTQRPEKMVVRIRGGYCDLNRREYTGVVDSGTGVAVSEGLYQEMVKSAPYFSNQIDNKTQRANADNPIIEEVADLAGESAVYALTDKHQKLEDSDQRLLEERSRLAAVYKSIVLPEQERRTKHLETYRLYALTSIQEMARVACKSLGYGTNGTQNTLNAVASNIHRSPEAGKWLATYTSAAIRYNDAVRGKINQSIHGVIDEISFHRGHLINNIDRVYTD